MSSVLFGAMRIPMTFAASSPFTSGIEWGLAILVPLMIMGIGGVYVLGLRTRPTEYVNGYTTGFEKVSCRSRGVGCLVSLVGLALLIGGAFFLITHG